MNDVMLIDQGQVIPYIWHKSRAVIAKQACNFLNCCVLVYQTCVPGDSVMSYTSHVVIKVI